MIGRIAQSGLAQTIRSALGIVPIQVRHPGQDSEGAKQVWKLLRWCERQNESRHRAEYNQWESWVKKQVGPQ